MFERFTDRARQVVVKAQEEARLLGHNYIGTEHLLLGMLAEGDGIAGKALTDMGLTLDVARYEIEQSVGRGTEDRRAHIPFTREAKKTLELALRQALVLGHNYIGTEHLLLGLLKLEDDADQGIGLLDVDASKLRLIILGRIKAADGRGRSAELRTLSDIQCDIDVAEVALWSLQAEFAEAQARENPEP